MFEDFFTDVSTGKAYMPAGQYLPRPEYIDSLTSRQLRYSNLFLSRLSNFWLHYVCSIPWIFEEQCRIGFRLNEWLRVHCGHSPALVYFPKGADGADARVLAEYGEGAILTLVNTGSMAVCQDAFNLNNKCSWSHSIAGRYEYIGRGYLSKSSGGVFSTFDAVYCNVTFQFSNSPRSQSVRVLKDLLQPAGLFFCLEKVMSDSRATYDAHEKAKDNKFKSLYFSDRSIEGKKRDVLLQMEKFMVEEGSLVDALKRNFSCVHRIWASGNFCEYLATDSHEHADAFMSDLPDPFIPSDFCSYKVCRIK